MAANREALDLTYASQMRNHPYGTALYTPLPFKQLHPGVVGYFSSTGLWNPISDLSSQPSLSAAPPESYIWGPKISSSTKATKNSLALDLDSALATALPFDVGAWYKFSSENEGGAVLLTKGEVRHERFYYESPFKDWVRDNAEKLVIERKELLEDGMWVVTSTWSAQEVAVNCWKEKGRSISVGFKAGVVGIGEVAPSGEWAVGNKDGSWVKAASKEGDGGRVVFFGGLRFRYRRVPFGQKLKLDKKPTYFRGDHEDSQGTEVLAEISIPDAEAPEKESTFELECEPVFETVPASGKKGEEDEEW